MSDTDTDTDTDTDNDTVKGDDVCLTQVDSPLTGVTTSRSASECLRVRSVAMRNS